MLKNERILFWQRRPMSAVNPGHSSVSISKRLLAASLRHCEKIKLMRYRKDRHPSIHAGYCRRIFFPHQLSS
jgi:hypothetical protein